MIVDDIDLGPSHPWQGPQAGQQNNSVLIEGSRTVIWPRGRTLERQDVTLWVQAWQAVGGQAARSLGAVQYLIRQLEERAGGSAEPVYIRWTSTAASGGYSVADAHDGWYVIETVQPNYLTFIISGYVQVRITVDQAASAAPAPLAMWWSGGALASAYSATALPIVSCPLGSTGTVATALSRTGAEGLVPTSVLASGSTLNPVPFVPGTVGQLFQGGVRLYDTINTSSNPVPTSGGFANANWVQVYAVYHDFVGDCVVTNGLLLLLLQPGQSNVATVYVWNTLLGTPAWQLQGTVEYQEDAANSGVLRQIGLERVSLDEVRLRARAVTPSANWGEVLWKVQRGRYDAQIQFTPLTETNTQQQGLLWRLNTAGRFAYNEQSVVDLTLNAGTNVTPSSTLGFGAVLGLTANEPILGWLYLTAPVSQPGTFSTTVIGFGDTSGPTVRTARTYGIFVTPFTSTMANLQAEGESGTLGTGWSSVADGTASGGNTAKVASGTVSGNADLFGTSWVPPAAGYGVPFRIKVTSAASTTAQLQVGLWDTTSAAFVPLASTIYAPSQWTTSYTWGFVNVRSVVDGVLNSTTTVTSATAVFTSADANKAISGAGIVAGTTISSVTNATTIVLSVAATATATGVTLTIGAPVTPTATHNMQFRCVTTATLGTDFFVDEAALLPIQANTLGSDSQPGDIYVQWAFDRVTSLVRG